MHATHALPDDTISYLDTQDRSPYAFYERLLEGDPVHYDTRMAAWLVASPALIKQVLRDDEVFAQPYASMRAGETYKALRINNPRSFQFLTGAEHRAMHAWWIRDLLSVKWVNQYKASAIQPVIDRVLHKLDGRQGFDLVTDYAEQIPVGVFANLMGLDWQDDGFLKKLKALNDDIAVFASLANSLQLESHTGTAGDAVVERALAAGEELNRILVPTIEQRRAGDGTDFISRLWEGGRKLYGDWNEIDTLDSCRRLLFAGSDTTTHAIANAFRILLTDAEVRRQVQADPAGTMANLCEETLRLFGSVHFRIRRVTAPCVLGGRELKKDDMVVALLLAANRDPAQYGCPHAAQLDRKSPRDHLSFSYGPRACPGSNLARAEMELAIGSAIRKYPALCADIGMARPDFTGFLLRSFTPLHVRVGGPAA